MKNTTILSTLLFLLIFLQSIHVQSQSFDPPVSPFKSGMSTQFGQDVVIYDQPGQNQQNLAICSAPNGWLYAAYSFDSVGFSLPWVNVLRSKNNGQSWNIILQAEWWGGTIYTKIQKIDLLVTGANETDHKLFLASVTKCNRNGYIFDHLCISKFNCDPWLYDFNVFYQEGPPNHYLAIANDGDFPAALSNPGSIAFVYSTKGTYDSLIFQSSADGGMTFPIHKVITVTTKKIGKVDLAYGRSLSQNTGRYFVAWEELATTSSEIGHIYTAHSVLNFNGPFTAPVQLDGLDPTMTNLCRNPNIACQANNVDNDSADLSSVIIFEKLNTAGEFDIMGFYSKKTDLVTNYTKFTVAATSNHETQPDLIFNPHDSAFLLTYYDSSAHKLPLLKNDFNLISPDNWTVMTPGYNDSDNLTTPGPRICINGMNNMVCNVWSGNSSAGKGVALLDAQYNYPVNINKEGNNIGIQTIETFPNPCSASVSVTFTVVKTEHIRITVRNLTGQFVATLAEELLQPGKQRFTWDVSLVPPGLYFYTISLGAYSTTGKIVVMR